MRGRWAASLRGSAYLLSALPSAVLVLPLSGLASWHRRRAGRLLGVPAPAVRQGEGSWWRRLKTDPATRREALWPLVHLAIALPVGLLTLVCLGNIPVALTLMTLWWAIPGHTPPNLLGDIPVDGWDVALTVAPAQVLGLTAFALWFVPPMARAHARACLAMLSPTSAERLAERVEVLTRTREEAVGAHGAELRRIERDLHDGVQARLVAVTMRLGLARESLADGPDGAAELVGEAHDGVEEAMAELRGVIRTIYPPILADRGLSGAMSALAARSAVPVDLRVGDLGPLPAAVETVAYFVVTEALTNTAKHGRATRAEVCLDRSGDQLNVEIRDDGIGGADEQRGTGIAGLRRRVLALDGTVQLTSPVGGPTTIRVELPCRS
ncbi:sensor histidine kinase [Actinomadura rudentiformis]|uniref:histidine kinase n=1 Tax=Actinomadura rudentiformis TaxID=359158 RepID=A0A6H9Z0C9_9ACTN|nr:sensor histidine kinase [Actinomadura rudentiformis]KAB2350165.1 sensor histidine kinase [Actinomadura rudentiformis]